MERLGPLLGLRRRAADPVGTVVLLHGIGLGPWFWDPWAPRFAEARLDTVALTLPGHEPGARDIGFADAVAQVESALDAIGGPVTLVGHSLGGLVAQVVAARREVRALALVCGLPPGNLRFLPPLSGARGSGPMLAALVRGRPLPISWESYRKMGLATLSEEDARAFYARVVPWPNRLVRELLLARPAVDPRAVKAPVLVTIGYRDPLVPWSSGRVMGDLYDAVVWRYDDLGHNPPWEPGGARLGGDLAGWCAAPTRPQVLESEGFGPAEGVGHELRRERRGEAMKKRSAYGQKRAGR